jgi:hypothetical protein
MVGLFIDVFIAYLVKWTLRLVRAKGSGGWKSVAARLDSSRLDDSWVWNCPTVHIACSYEFEGRSHAATDSKPFLSGTFAKEYLERLKVRETVLVRVNPQQPERSVLRES